MLPTVQLLTRASHIASHSRRVEATEVCQFCSINWCPKENCLRNIANHIGKHLIVICNDFIDSLVYHLDGKSSFSFLIWIALSM